MESCDGRGSVDLPLGSRIALSNAVALYPCCLAAFALLVLLTRNNAEGAIMREARLAAYPGYLETSPEN